MLPLSGPLHTQNKAGEGSPEDERPWAGQKPAVPATANLDHSAITSNTRGDQAGAAGGELIPGFLGRIFVIHEPCL